MRRAFLLFAACASIALAQAPVPALDTEDRGVGKVYEDEFTCPTSPTAITTVSTWIKYLSVSVGATAAGNSPTMTVQNGQQSPLKWMDAVELPSATSLTIIALPPGGKLSRSGLTLSCSTAGIVIYIRYWVR